MIVIDDASNLEPGSDIKKAGPLPPSPVGDNGTISSVSSVTESLVDVAGPGPVHTDHDLPPPAYTPAPSTSAAPPSSGSGSSAATAPAPAPDPLLPLDTKATNFVSIARFNGPIRGAFVLDPALAIPAALLPPLPDYMGQGHGGERKTLWLASQNGAVSADVWIVPRAEAEGVRGHGQDKDKRARATLGVCAENGGVTVRIRSTMLDTAPPPLSLRIYAANGHVTAYLPRTFRGTLTLTTHNGWTTLTPALGAALAFSAEERRTRRCFVGALGGGGGGEAGGMDGGEDEVVIETMNGKLKVGYADEDLPAPKVARTGAGGGGFFARVFGL